MKMEVNYGVRALDPINLVYIPPLTKADIRRLRWESFKYGAIQVLLLMGMALSFAVMVHGVAGL